MVDFIRNSVEIQHWGWNIGTIGAVGTFVFTLLQAVGFSTQARSIWKSRSGASVSIPMAGFWGVYFICFFIYAIDAKSIAMVWNCTLLFPVLVMIAGLWKYKRDAFRDWAIVGLCMLGIPAMIWFPKDAVLTSLFVIAFAVLLHQALDVRKNGPGVLHPAYIVIFILTGLFWLVFTITIGNWVIAIFNCCTIPTWIYLYRKWYVFTRVR